MLTEAAGRSGARALANYAAARGNTKKNIATKKFVTYSCVRNLRCNSPYTHDLRIIE